MASLEIGQSNKSISYMNLSKTGTRYKNEDHGDECSIKHTFGSRPWLDKQSDWLVCITRFCVPLHSIPIIDAMPDAIQILALRADKDLTQNYDFGGVQHPNRHDVWLNDVNGILMDLERPADPDDQHRNMVDDPDNLLHSVDLPTSDTVYEFLRSVRDSLANKQLDVDTKASDVIRIVLGPNFKFSVLIRGD